MPVRVDALPTFCCECRTATFSGIFVRCDPRVMPCKGKDGEHAIAPDEN